MCQSGVVSINGIVAKSSRYVKIGDKITITFLTHKKTYQVLALPKTKSISKSLSNEYVREIT